MVCCQVFGNHAAITFAGSQGHFELNVYKPVIAYNFLQSIRLLADAARSLHRPLRRRHRADEKRIKELMERSLMLVTALAPKIGYDNAAKIAKTAHTNGTTLKEEALRLGFVTAEEFDRLVRPGEDDAARDKFRIPIVIRNDTEPQGSLNIRLKGRDLITVNVATGLRATQPLRPPTGRNSSFDGPRAD